ncbi:DNA polymerase III subunit beta [Candidatus Kinetoplastibacterium oncopeltii TCC290E]|uniref:Beta sliding clamp n=1 Tax=Candidatus Kinetoplastidibacterium stringomonadis TCC290E TaxID=1208920 RepID=M1LXW7_9PROT|nr:DNA polymerase III subunit beta [Candidatus Kinetoplastibacterium oncopeltii]AGF48034.1 DNA polymerase III subunit beta [Candidatus Kinetoplastibacterium oncopeltii TCC290E]
MKFLHVVRESLLKTLSNIVGIVERRNTMPILSNLMIRKDKGNKVAFITTDIEVQMTTYANCGSGESEVSTTVSARKFLDILKALPDMSNINVELHDNKIYIESSKSRFNLQTINSEEFPVMSCPDTWDISVRLSQRDLKSLFSMVYFSMAQQDIRYYLNGMLLVFKDNCIFAVSTDGHRLSYNSIEANEFEGCKEVIVPRKTILELQRLLQDSDDIICIDVSSSQIKFCFRDIEFISKLVEGKFPDFRKVIPNNYPISFPINREYFQGSLQRVAIITNDKFKGVRFHFETNNLKVSSSNTDHEEAQEDLEIDYRGNDFDVGFNVNYLLDVISNLKSENLIWSITPDSNASVLITVPDDPNFKYVVMPMRI